MNYSANGMDYEAEPLHAVKAVLSGYNFEVGQYSMALLFLSFCVTILFLSCISRRMVEAFRLDVFTRTRVEPNRLLRLHSRMVIARLAAVLLAKIVADILTDKIADSWQVAGQYLVISLSVVLTLLVWFYAMHLLTVLHMKGNLLFVGFAATIIICQYLTLKLPMLNTLVLYSGSFDGHATSWLALKVVILVLLLGFNFKAIRTYEII
jgi:hypothetical protein